MLMDKQAGIDCINCGHQEVVKTELELIALQDKLEWGHDSPFCPSCGHIVTLENYLDDDV